MGEIKNVAKSAFTAGAGFGIGYYLAKLKYHRRKITFGVLLSSAILYTSVSFVNDLPAIFRDKNKHDFMIKELEFKKDSLEIIHGINSFKKNSADLKSQYEDIKKENDGLKYENSILQNTNALMKQESERSNQEKNLLKSELKPSSENSNKRLQETYSMTNESLERKVSFLGERDTDSYKNRISSNDNNQRNMQSDDYESRFSKNIAKTIAGFILDADKSSHEMSLYAVFDDGSKKFERSFPVNFAIGGNPQNGEYAVQRILPSKSNTAPYFLEMKYPIGTAGAGPNSEFEYNILNHIDNNKTGMRIRNKDMLSLVNDISGLKTIVSVHD